MVALVFRINPAAPYEPFPKVKLGAIHCHLHILNAELEVQHALRLPRGYHPGSTAACGHKMVSRNGVDVCKDWCGKARRLVNDWFASKECDCMRAAGVIVHECSLKLAQGLLNRFTDLQCVN